MKNSIPYGFERMVYRDRGLYLKPYKYDKFVRFDIDTEEFSYFEKNDRIAMDIFNSNIYSLTRKICNYKLPIDIVYKVRAEQIKDDTWGTGTMYENDKNSLQDYLYYIMINEMHIKANTQARFMGMINNYDGTCGEERYTGFEK